MNAYSRREFLQSSLAMVSACGTVPAFLNSTGNALAAPYENSTVKNLPGIPEDRVLVVIQLSGGNDGINTVIPFGSSTYYDVRPRIAVSAHEVLKLDTADGIGLHPAMSGFHKMVQQGNAAIIQGVGYPNPNRSHFVSMDIWHTGTELENGNGTGWIGRAMDSAQHSESSMPVIALGKEAPSATVGKRHKPVSFQQPNLFRFTGRDLHEAIATEYDRANRAGVLPSTSDPDGHSNAAFLMRTSLDAQLASDRIRAAVARQPEAEWPGGGLAGQLRMIAAMIRAELPTRVYYAAMGGFDTHANQPGGHSNLLSQFSEATAAFYREMQAIGRAQDVMTLAFSEFGRRVAQNGSNGTDHGAAGPMFLMGPMVQPGLRGQHPSLTNLDRGDLIYNTDFRSVYAGVLQDWMKLGYTQPTSGRRDSHSNKIQPIKVTKT